MLQLQDNIVFDEATHTYCVGGIIVPSVTEILKELGFIDTRWYTNNGSDRGKVIHKLCEDYDNGNIDWGEVGEYAGYIKAWAKFVDDYGEEWEGVEVAAHCGVLAGTIDRVSSTAIVDIKTGQKSKWHRLQLSLYHLMIPREKIFAVRIRANGRYSIDSYDPEPNVYAIRDLLKMRQKYGNN